MLSMWDLCQTLWAVGALSAHPPTLPYSPVLHCLEAQDEDHFRRYHWGAFGHRPHLHGMELGRGPLEGGQA